MTANHAEEELNHLVKMANQITQNICIGGSNAEQIDRVKNHINLFWARPMKEKICSSLDLVKEDLSPITLEALQIINTEL